MELSRLLRPVRTMMIAVFAAGFLASAFTLMAPIAVTALASRALDATLDAPTAWLCLAAIAVGFAASHLIVLAATGRAHIVESAFRHDLRSRIAHHLARLPLGWHTAESSGRVRTIVSEDVTKIHTIIAHSGTDLGHALGTLLLGSAYLFSLSWQYALLLVGWLVACLLVFFLGMLATPSGSIEVFTEAEKDLTSSTIELADGIATVKAFGMSTSLFQRFSDALDRYTTASYEWMKGPGTPMAVTMALFSPAGLLIPILLGAWGLDRLGLIDPVLIVPFLLVGVTLPSGLSRVIPLAHLLAQGKDAAERISALLDEEPLAEPASPATIPDGAAADIVFDDVSFRYSDTAPDALHSISARFPADSVTAVVGPSGSGKSTLVTLIARFWDVSSGRILLAGTPITELASSDLLSRMAIVLQDGGLIADTVEENIRLGHPGASRAQVEEAARAARIHDRILELPDGYDSVVGSPGVHFSGGEAQRIALARAFIGDPDVLLLDEATAQADPHSERRIQEALGALARGRTTIVIAHRLSTIVDADQILVLDEGRLVESGTHRELVELGGTYAAMWEAQQ
ncbi:ABC transporter ATP-binding protein/permease [Actinomyces sp. B33]|uniref:ABC transporter ATP-binding protein n=1 Tax=Actinomyces sp. B33 TaxID=2942131 RepID=UPI002342104B|nr:ABC transporter ATP-binding protein [Actinomyces sp. B33]MDC4232166.1 ABC transporter ATP-binding protein/permease [Actinomyces sp. B33]